MIQYFFFVFTLLLAQPANAQSVDCNGLDNYLKARAVYGRDSLERVCSPKMRWNGRVNCGAGEQHKYGYLDLTRVEMGLFVCKSAQYAKKNEVLYGELREFLLSEGASPIPCDYQGSTPEGMSELCVGSGMSSGRWRLATGETIDVIVQRNGLATIYEDR